MQEAARREALEETGLHVSIDSLLGVFHSPRTSEDTFGINLVFAATAVGGSLTPTTEHPELVIRRPRFVILPLRADSVGNTPSQPFEPSKRGRNCRAI